MAQEQGHELGTIYGVGDNPLTDIKGANDAKKADARWQSVLTRTGMFQGGVNPNPNPHSNPNWMFQGGVNDEVNPGDMVVEDLLEWYEAAKAAHA